jgi:phage host-nuclease inhibitor protein Gam
MASVANPTEMASAKIFNLAAGGISWRNPRLAVKLRRNENLAKMLIMKT